MGFRYEVWDLHVPITVFKTDKQQGRIVYHRELCSVFFNSLKGKRS